MLISNRRIPKSNTALCAEIKPRFLLRGALRKALNKNLVPHALEKPCIALVEQEKQNSVLLDRTMKLRRGDVQSTSPSLNFIAKISNAQNSLGFWTNKIKAASLLTGIALGLILQGCDTVETQTYNATAQVTYTWQVEYIPITDNRRSRLEQFASTSLMNVNGDRPAEAVTGPDDEGLWWPQLPPRPTVDELEARQQQGEEVGTPELLKSVDYAVTYAQDGQTRTLPTNASVYRQVVRSRPQQEPLEFILSLDGNSVVQAKPE